jgi:cell division protein FtsN
MAARRGKKQARRNGGSSGRPLWQWFIVAFVLGGLGFGYLHYKDQLKQPLSGLLPTPDPDAKAKPPSSEDAVADAGDKPRTKYDFYKLLPEKEVVIPDAELDAQAKAEAAQAQQLAAERAERAEREAAAARDDGPADSLTLDRDAPASAAPAPGTTAAATPAPAPAPASATAPIAAQAASPNGPQYVIQAGAFLGSDEAEALKAKIALTGEVARVEVAQINGNTVHRVRMGPYPNAASLAAAKSALAAHGIDAQAIRVK